MNIDWSKAPEGATHYDPAVQMFYRPAAASEWEFYLGADYGWTSSDDWRGRTAAPGSAIERSTNVTWTGEGLPPVGTVCLTEDEGRQLEVRILGYSLRAGKRPERTEVVTAEIIETGRLKAWVLRCCEFRPVRTEREKGVDALCEFITRVAGGNDFHRPFWERAYDKGLRAPE